MKPQLKPHERTSKYRAEIIQQERQRLKKKIEKLKDIDAGCNDEGCLSCHIKRCSYNHILALLDDTPQTNSHQDSLDGEPRKGKEGGE